MLIMLVFFCCHIKIVVAMVTVIVKMLQKHMYPEIRKNYSSWHCETLYVIR